MFAPRAVEVIAPEKLAVPNCAPPTAFSWPAIVEEAETESEPVEVAFVVVSPPLNAMSVEVALPRNG